MSIRARETQRAQDREIERGIFDVTHSFHNEFRQCPCIIVRNLSYQLSEGDIATMFEQYGTLVAMELLRDKDTGGSKGIAIMTYEDPRSAVVAVDNFNGVTLLGRAISVDHVDYKISDKSNVTDPRTRVPARLRPDKTASAKPAFDEGSASSTDDTSDWFPQNMTHHLESQVLYRKRSLSLTVTKNVRHPTLRIGGMSK
jgi:RNA-binding motif X-linked protein 2